jgi:hypothetical protein
MIRGRMSEDGDDVPLIGIRLLSGSRVTMDVFPDGEVLIEEVV